VHAIDMNFGSAAFLQLFPGRLPFGLDLVLSAIPHQVQDCLVLLFLFNRIEHLEEVVVRHRFAHLFQVVQNPFPHRGEAFGRNNSAVEREQVCLSRGTKPAINARAGEGMVRLRAKLRAWSEEGAIVSSLLLVPQKLVVISLQALRLAEKVRSSGEPS
jgi:hypothetical protein